MCCLHCSGNVFLTHPADISGGMRLICLCKVSTCFFSHWNMLPLVSFLMHCGTWMTHTVQEGSFNWVWVYWLGCVMGGQYTKEKRWEILPTHRFFYFCSHVYLWNISHDPAWNLVTMMLMETFMCCRIHRVFWSSSPTHPHRRGCQLRRWIQHHHLLQAATLVSNRPKHKMTTKLFVGCKITFKMRIFWLDYGCHW